LTIDGTQPQKLNVNRLTLNELRQHPYINYFQARAIVDYRRVCGTLTNLREQLSLSKDFSPDDFSRLEPYVEY
jgi:DNA uptake protein ComE-like DNA-binding protein